MMSLPNNCCRHNKNNTILEHITAMFGVLVVVLWHFCALADVAAVAADDAIPHRTSDDIYMNPCKASAFSGDIALSEDEARTMEKSILRDQQLLKLGINKQLQFLTNKTESVRKQLREARWNSRIYCIHGPNRRKPFCRKLRRTIRNFRRQHKSINKDIQDLQAQFQKLKGIKKKPHSRHRRAATAIKDRLWDFGVVPFTIDGNFTGRIKELFILAMRHWENHTCITFREKEPTDTNYITFTVQDCGCCSYVGKKGRGAQAISIGKHCDKFGIVVHELGHVIGFWHEHTRPDRDDHVQILWGNIQAGQAYNFDKMTNSDINSLGEEYDFDSIMHYSRNTFAKKSFSILDTIVPRRKPGVAVVPNIGQRVSLSPGDIRQANKLYKCPSCGRTLQDATGDLSHTPIRRKPELCRWRITATHGEKIVLNITQLNIPKTRNCRTDYLEVRDGYYIRSPLLGRYCGDELPDSLESKGPRLWIEFRSRNGQGGGFAANYEAMCGGEIATDEGYLTSPNFPDNYRPDKTCIWKITVKDGYTVALKFETFDLETIDNCLYDYLEVRDGPDSVSPLLGNFCGYKIPKDIQSTGNHLFVRFVSDSNVQKLGFFAKFIQEFDECVDTEHGCDQICENTLGSYKCSCRLGYELHTDGKTCQDACGGYIIDSENGTIESPSFPDLYPPNKNCVWQMMAPRDHKIHINFTHFDLEGSNQDCEFDSVQVSSGIRTNLKHHGTFCGSSFPAPVTSEGNQLQIEFNSDNSVQKTGFTLVYRTDKDECSTDNGGCQHECINTVGSYKCACKNGYTMHDDGHGCKEGGCHYDISTPLGVARSPNFPDDYPSRKDCVWSFTTEPGQRIRLQFNTFELEPHQDCTYDHVAAYDGADKNAPRLGKFCGASIPKTIISTGNKMYLTFFSDVSVERKGFEIEHDTVCGADLYANETSQTFVSHARYGDYNYDNRLSCDWKITGPKGTKVVLQFLEMSVEDEYDCSYDSISVYEGPKADKAKRIEIYCGSPEGPSPAITSESETLLVRFQSDDTIMMKGFLASYKLDAPPETSDTRGR